jgi:uncharacterized membrane protein
VKLLVRARTILLTTLSFTEMLDATPQQWTHAAASTSHHHLLGIAVAVIRAAFTLRSTPQIEPWNRAQLLCHALSVGLSILTTATTHLGASIAKQSHSDSAAVLLPVTIVGL